MEPRNDRRYPPVWQDMQTKRGLKVYPTRRTTLGALARAGAAAFFIPAWNETLEAADALTCVSSTPSVTEGPYWVDEKLFRSDIRTDPSTGVARAGAVSHRTPPARSAGPLAAFRARVALCSP